MPATPLPQPRSRTVCPRTQAGSACTTRASSGPPARWPPRRGPPASSPTLLLPGLPQGKHAPGRNAPPDRGDRAPASAGPAERVARTRGTSTGRSAAGGASGKGRHLLACPRAGPMAQCARALLSERVTAGMARATAQKTRLARASRLKGTQASSATRSQHGLAIAHMRQRRGISDGTAWHAVQKYTSSLARHAGAHRQRAARTQGSPFPCGSSGTASSILAAGSPFPVS